MAPKVFSAICWFYEACDFDQILGGCKAKSECLCLVRECCFAAGEEPVGTGLITNPENKECCKIGLYCCACGIKQPERLCAIAEHAFCLKAAGSIPPDKEYLDQCVCATHCISCAPECGCCVDAPACPALNKAIHDYHPAPTAMGMDRDEMDVELNGMQVMETKAMRID